MPRSSRSEVPAGKVVASWQRDAVHVWGWDGVQTMAPFWLSAGFRGTFGASPPSAYGFHSSLDVVAPSGERLRPVSVRLDAVAGLGWLRAATVESDSLTWFGTLAKLAERVVAAGAVVPTITSRPEVIPGDLPSVVAEVHWTPATGDTFDACVDALAAAMPPICLPDVPRDDAETRRATVDAIFERFVDNTARARLQRAGWEPIVPRNRSAATAVARSVFGALTGQDPRVQLTRAVHADALGPVEEFLRRLGHRARDEPVLVRRLRLVVPDDRGDPWRVDLELVDEADPGRWCAAADVWAGNPLAVEVATAADHLALLESSVRELAATVAADVGVLAALADDPRPAAVELDVDGADEFLDAAPAALERRGIELIGPEHLVRASVAVRGRATPAPASDRAAGFNRQTIVHWSFTAAVEDGHAAITEAELARAEQTGASLLYVGHRWVRIDPAALRKVRARREAYQLQLEDVTAAQGNGEANPLALLRLAAEAAAAGDDVGLATGELEAADGNVVSEAWSGLLLGGLPDTELREEIEPASFVGELRPYQRRGLSWMRFLERLDLGGCLADDMGLGKTATTLAHLVDRPGPHLVVCPLSVVHNWETETRRFTPSIAVTVHHGAQRHGAVGNNGDNGDGSSEGESAGVLAASDLVVTTYGLLTRDLDVLAAVDWSTVVLDEAQFVKNPATMAARGVRKLRAQQRLALTGTPVENRLSELWAILDWVNPGMLGTREKFRHHYSKPIERGDDGSVAAEAAAALKALTRPFVLRRSKADRQLVPELPDKIEQIAWAGLTREQAVLYQKVVDQLLADANSNEGIKRRAIVLAALTKLKQICNHPAHALGDQSRLHGRSGKLARFDELVDELVDVDERALVFTQFVEMGALLRRHVAERFGWSVPFLHGSMPKARRDHVVAEFQAGAGPPLLLVSLKAGGTGLNLTAASQVVHYDRWWNPAVENQATDRAWRIGQGHTVLVHKLVCEGTVEERIAKLIDDKQALADLVVGHGEAWLSELTTSELRELVRLDASALAGVATP
jgi:superfamily II DNA or RNA helicase